jgi:hypothetical protein
LLELSQASLVPVNRVDRGLPPDQLAECQGESAGPGSEIGPGPARRKPRRAKKADVIRMIQSPPSLALEDASRNAMRFMVRFAPLP